MLQSPLNLVGRLLTRRTLLPLVCTLIVTGAGLSYAAPQFSGVGRINTIRDNKVVINDATFTFADVTTFYDASGNQGSVNLLKTDEMVTYEADTDGIIYSIRLGVLASQSDDTASSADNVTTASSGAAEASSSGVETSGDTTNESNADKDFTIKSDGDLQMKNGVWSN